MSGIVNSTGARSGIIGTTVGTPAGDWVKLHSATDSFMFDGIFTTDYNVYKIFLYNFHTDSDNQNLYGLFRIGDADASASNYQHVLQKVQTTSSAGHSGDTVRGWSSNNFTISATGIDNTDTYPLDVEMTLLDPLNTSKYKMIRHESTQTSPDLLAVYTTWGMAQYTANTTALSGMNFTSTGSLVGKISVYGLKN